ncbi:hypothetical protein [Agrobacterium sp. RAC06]|uniref:hypothetical protein n=1 Tax=Agrobacterium sp. RAC06 TaxID=1842536 RepID=UPI00083E3BAF|nr:hypothetical protein [Agrobacterium sp. RAC06]AOG09613.1 hypothetical protein BSY240_2254 [Agrobacterium sp. RAC06]
MQLTRIELYQRVCNSPLNKIAPELGLSAPALSAICKKHDVPFPGAGYWTRKAMGLPAELLPLPVADDDIIDLSQPVKRPQRQGPPLTREPRKKRSVKPHRRSRHPFLLGVEEHFRKTRVAEEYEFLRPYKRILPDIVASESSLPRALAIANQLYLTIEEAGCKLRIATAEEKLQRIDIDERENERKDRKYGRYQSGRPWGPDRATVFEIGTVPIGIAVTEMTERVTMRYLEGSYHRVDSKIIRSAKAWQLVHSYTHLQDVPSGRFKIVAYSPKSGVEWSISRQDTEQASLESMIPEFVEALQVAVSKVQALMIAADEAAEQRRQEWKAEWERYLRKEDKRKSAEALLESQKQLVQIIEQWTKVMAVEQFFRQAENRLVDVADDRREHIETRLALARKMIGDTDPFQFLASWVAPEERYKSPYDDAPEPKPEKSSSA